MTETFARIIDFSLEQEGGYVNDPADPGGETNYGISKRSYPDLEIKRLTRDHAISLYRSEFWERLSLPSMAPAVAAATFDAAVNCGPGSAVRWLQSGINDLVHSPTGSDIDVDGDLGPQTIAASQHCSALRLAMAIQAARLRHYCRLAAKHPQYLRGWAMRLAALQDLIVQEAI